MATVHIIAEPTEKHGVWLVSLTRGPTRAESWIVWTKQKAEHLVRRLIRGAWKSSQIDAVEAAAYGTDGRLTWARRYEQAKAGKTVAIDRTEHVRKRHERSGFTRVDPRTGKKVKVSAATVRQALIPRAVYTIADVGTSGKQSRGAEKGPHTKEKPWITREGKLGRGFLTQLSSKDQKAVLDRCITKHKYRSCLGSILVLERSAPLREKYGARLEKLREYLKGKFGGPGSFGPRAKKRG